MRRALKKFIDTHEKNNLTLIYEGFGNKTIQNLAFPLQVAVKVDVPMAEFYGRVKLSVKDDEKESVFILRVYEDKAKYVIFKEDESDIELALKYYRQGHGDDEWQEIDIPFTGNVESIVEVVKRVAKNNWSEYDILKDETTEESYRFSIKEKVLIGAVAVIVLALAIAGIYINGQGEPLRMVAYVIAVLILCTIINRRQFKKYRRKKDMNSH